jgi:hypothetical protein
MIRHLDGSVMSAHGIAERRPTDSITLTANGRPNVLGTMIAYAT